MSTVMAAQPAAAEASRTSQVRRLWQKFAHDPLGMAALVILLLVIIAALFAPWLTPKDPVKTALTLRLKAPGVVAGYVLGTDKVGRDVASRVIIGARTALTVAFASTIISLLIGTLLGLLAGYFRGWVDGVISVIVDIMMAFPFILLALAVAAVLGPGMWKLILVIGATSWTDYARVVRSEALILREKDFVTAARAMGGQNWRILFKHLLPNCFASIIVLSTLALARTILLESSLSYLGLGVPPTIPDWGYMLADSLQYIVQAPWLGIYPGLAILLTVLSINLVGDRVRDVLDPKVN